MGNLKTALNNLYKALLNDEPSTVQNSYNATIKALIDIYEKRGAISL